MKTITTVLLTKEECAKLDARTYIELVFKPVNVFEDNKLKTYYMPYKKLINNKLTPFIEVKEEWIR